jgi:hypothetical protein
VAAVGGEVPPLWTIEENNGARFIVRDKNGQALGYFYFEDEPGRLGSDRLWGIGKRPGKL